MSALFIYLIKVNVALILFCMGYYFVLRHLTFYTLNRVYLVCAILFSTLYPFVNFSGFINRHKEIARPVQMVVVNWEAPVTNAVHSAIATHQTYTNWPLLILWVGIITFALRFIFQLISLYRLHRKSQPMLLNRHQIRAVEKDINPFSFLKSIYINPKNHDRAELETILEHEQVHINEWHTADILLSELSIIFYWFNPGVWLLKRAIHENIEFITDHRILQNGLDAKAYQYSLLTVNFNNNQNMLASHFNASVIKKRIIMMNAERSSLFNMGRYLLLIPVLALLLFVFSSSKIDLSKQVLKGKTLLVNSVKNLATQMENAQVADIPTQPSRQPLLQDYSVNKLDAESANKPKGTELTPVKITTDKGDSTNRILPLSANSYPDSIYVDGVYGETKSMLRYLKQNDISASSVYYPSSRNLIVVVYTKHAIDYRPFFIMDEEVTKAHNSQIHITRGIVIDGVISTREALEKIPMNKIDHLQGTNYAPGGERGNGLWVTTKK